MTNASLQHRKRSYVKTTYVMQDDTRAPKLCSAARGRRPHGNYKYAYNWEFLNFERDDDIGNSLCHITDVYLRRDKSFGSSWRSSDKLSHMRPKILLDIIGAAAGYDFRFRSDFTRIRT